MNRISLAAPALAAAAGAALAARQNKQQIPYSFKGRSVVITGASRGLGFVMARELAREGANLTILARNGAALEKAAQDLRSHGARVLPVTCDVGDREQMETAIRRAAEEYGGVDVLVNNAGVIQVGPLEHMTLDDFEQALAVHMWGPLYAMLAVIPHMRKRRGGRIINISSIGGKIAVPHLLPYSASKFALTGLSDGMRAGLARSGIRITTVIPGLMRTGSPPNALFRGQHEREYAWFSVLDSLPFTSVSAEKAARQIIEASRRGDPQLIISIQAQLAVLANALAPGLFAGIMKLTNNVMPKPGGSEGNRLKAGWESESAVSRSPLTGPTYKAAEKYNETVDRTVGDGAVSPIMDYTDQLSA